MITRLGDESIELTCSSMDFLSEGALVWRLRGVAEAGLDAATRSNKLFKLSSRFEERYGAKIKSSRILHIQLQQGYQIMSSEKE